MCAYCLHLDNNCVLVGVRSCVEKADENVDEDEDEQDTEGNLTMELRFSINSIIRTCHL